jgi:uncharacterized membrane protein
MTNDKLQISNEDKLLSATAYAFFIPSLYIILTDKRKNEFDSYAAAQSILLWLAYLVIFILLRILLNLIWSVFYLPFLETVFTAVKMAMWVYALYLATQALYGVNVRVPFVSNLADKLC